MNLIHILKGTQERAIFPRMDQRKKSEGVVVRLVGVKGGKKKKDVGRRKQTETQG